MRTRASPTSPDQVNALNAIPLEFVGVEKVIASYRTLINHLNTPTPGNPEVWINRRIDLFMDMLHEMSSELDYDFTVAQLKGEFYSPKAHADLEADQVAIRQGLARVLKGEAALAMDIKSFPGDPEAQAALKRILTGEQALKVTGTPAEEL